MWRGYGLAEFFWVRESPDHPWEGHHFTLQVYRLAVHFLIHDLGPVTERR